MYMKYKDLIKEFGSEKKAAEFLNRSITCIKAWKGGIPWWSQCAIEKLSLGKLTAIEYTKKRKAK